MRLTVIAIDVTGQEPVETAVRVVEFLLLREEKREAESIRERRTAGAKVVTGRGLRAALQAHHHGRSRGEIGRRIGDHSQTAGIGPRLLDFLQTAAGKIALRS